MRAHVIITTEDDMRWWVDGDRYGWELPMPAPSFVRAWPIRYFRGFWLTYRVLRHEHMFSQLGMIASGYDRWVLYAIWRGWC